MEGVKVKNIRRGPFFFFFFFAFHLICYWEKAFHREKKSGKMTLPHQKKKNSCYVPDGKNHAVLF